MASGPKHNDRTVAQIAVVDSEERVVLNVFVKPNVPVMSYLTALTGITAELLEENGISIEEGKRE